jgi:hypothetical protein
MTSQATLLSAVRRSSPTLSRSSALTVSWRSLEAAQKNILFLHGTGGRGNESWAGLMLPTDAVLVREAVRGERYAPAFAGVAMRRRPACRSLILGAIVESADSSSCSDDYASGYLARRNPAELLSESCLRLAG